MDLLDVEKKLKPFQRPMGWFFLGCQFFLHTKGTCASAFGKLAEAF